MTSGRDRRRLFIDIETYSSVDIAKSGAYRYVEAPDFAILPIAYARDNGPVRVLDLTALSPDALRCQLPSGRVLSYWGARLDTEGSICFMGQNQTTRKWEKIKTWGGKLVENIVQAVARDCLAVALLRLDKAGHRIVCHVHDEIIVEAPEGSRWEDVADIMGQPIACAPGLLLRGDGYETPFYLKA